MQTVKMVISGAVNAGKTEFIKAISEIEVVSTERRATDDTKLIKKETTVAMDFGRIAVADDLVLHLFGTPGQKRFDFMWEILSEGMLGLVSWSIARARRPSAKRIGLSTSSSPTERPPTWSRRTSKINPMPGRRTNCA